MIRKNACDNNCPIIKSENSINLKNVLKDQHDRVQYTNLKISAPAKSNLIKTESSSY